MAAPIVVWRAAKMARRVAPLAAEAYRRWNALPPAEKERYKQRARAAGERGRRLLEQRRRGGPGGFGGGRG